MSSFLSDKNINHLQYQLRQIFPENKWTAIQYSTRDSVLNWYKQHVDQLQLVYYRDGIEGLNKRFIADMIASAEYFDNTDVPAYQQDQLFDTDISDPNIVADQPMPYVRGIEQPQFVFSTVEKTHEANGEPSTRYIYREKPSYGKRNEISHTLQGPGKRNGTIKHYSDTDGTFLSNAKSRSGNNSLFPVTNRDAFNIADRFGKIRGNNASDVTHYKDAQIVQGFNPGVPSCKYCPNSNPNNRPSHLQRNPPQQTPPPPPSYNPYKVGLPNLGSGLVSMPATSLYTANMPTYAGYPRQGYSPYNEPPPVPYNGGGQGQHPPHSNPSINKKPYSGDSILSKITKKFTGNRYPFRTKEDDSAVVSGNYGEQMSRHIYNSSQSKYFPNAYEGYKLGKFVEERSADDGDYVPYPNNVTTDIRKTLNQLSFGDVPVVTEMSDDQIAELGSQLYRNKDRVKRQRAPKMDGRCIPRQEYIELHDDYPTNEVRAKFHLDQIYNTPESRINTIIDPVMGKSNMWMSQERSVLDIPCASMTRVPVARASDRYSNTRSYADGFADSYAVPGCNSFNSEPRRNAYPNRDFIPARYTTTYGRY